MSSKDDIQDIKKRKEGLKERMLRRKQERQNLGIGETAGLSSATNKTVPTSSISLRLSDTSAESNSKPLVPTTKEDPQDTTAALPNADIKETTETLKQLTSTDLPSKFDGSEKETSRKEDIPETDQSDGNSLKRKRADSPEQRLEQVEASKDAEPEEVSIESLLSSSTFKEQESKEMGQELFELLSVPTAKEQSLAEKFKSQEGTVHEFCPHGTRDECKKLNTSCDKLHFKRIIKDHTDESLGDCSFLNTCFHMDTCKYVHYQVESPQPSDEKVVSVPAKKVERSDSKVTMLPAQWIQCDIRYLDMTVLGKYAVIMADPPWDIHMELPYGTMQDDEMRAMRIPDIQDDGFIFLWVTGRAMELGRECLRGWGYSQVEELIWVKTNQLQRLIRTGRTGHWLNHGKEHCLVGVKGNPQGYNKGLDCDVIVAEVRQTSHKPDEIYGLIERLSPGTRKIEFFGRMHNVQPNWVTLGNQLDGVHLVEPELINNFKEKYPDMNALKPPTK